MNVNIILINTVIIIILTVKSIKKVNNKILDVPTWNEYSVHSTFVTVNTYLHNFHLHLVKYKKLI
jgi:hypothetical protein